eukprot:6515081-Ditylum_brightwellii.AAC.1
MVIIKALQDTICNEAKLCIMTQLPTIIQEKKLLSDQPMVMLSTAGKGLSPFAVPELAEDLIGKMNKQVARFGKM